MDRNASEGWADRLESQPGDTLGPCLLFNSLLAESSNEVLKNTPITWGGTPGSSAASEGTPELPPRQEMTTCQVHVQAETALENRVTFLGSNDYKGQMLELSEAELPFGQKEP